MSTINVNDKTYTIRFTVNTTLQMMESKNGSQAVDLLISENPRIPLVQRLAAVRQILYFGLQHEYKNEFNKPEKAGVLLDDLIGKGAKISEIATLLVQTYANDLGLDIEEMKKKAETEQETVNELEDILHMLTSEIFTTN